MKRLVLLLPVVCLAFLCSCKSASRVDHIPKSACPDLTVGETPTDCPWAGIARALAGEINLKHDLGPAFDRFAEALRPGIEIDAQLHNLKDLWGLSSNIDEIAGGAIVNPALLDHLLSRMKVQPAVDNIVHAGVQHTYGYLLSLLKTPYGFKRARWVDGAIEAGFGLPKGGLGPEPKDGSLFRNLTWFAGKIALRDCRKAVAVLNFSQARVAPEIVRFDYAGLGGTRISEAVAFKNEKGRTVRMVELRTDIVPFLKTEPSMKNIALLVYSVDDSSGPTARLITAFAVDKGFVAKLTDKKTMGRNVVIKTRYNAYVKDVTDAKKPLFGSRSTKEGF